MGQYDIYIWGMGVWGKDLLLYLPRECKVKAFIDAVPPRRTIVLAVAMGTESQSFLRKNG